METTLVRLCDIGHRKLVWKLSNHLLTILNQWLLGPCSWEMDGLATEVQLASEESSLCQFRSKFGFGPPLMVLSSHSSWSTEGLFTQCVAECRAAHLPIQHRHFGIRHNHFLTISVVGLMCLSSFSLWLQTSTCLYDMSSRCMADVVLWKLEPCPVGS